MSNKEELKGLKKERDGVYLNAQGRRVWDKDFFAGRRTGEEEEEVETKEKHVSGRTKHLDFASTLGTSMIDGDTRKAGFLCKTCDYRSKDSADYLDHLNSPQHLDNAGISRVVKRSTVADVKNIFAKKRTREEYEDFDKAATSRLEEEEKEKEEIRDRKRRKKEEKRKEEEKKFHGIDEEMAAIMGLPASFGSTKK